MPKVKIPTTKQMEANLAEYERKKEMKESTVKEEAPDLLKSGPEEKPFGNTVHIVSSGGENLVVLDGRHGGYLGRCAKCRRYVTQFKKKRDASDPSDEDFRIALEQGDFETARKFVCSYEEVREMTIREWMMMKGGSQMVSKMGFGDDSPFHQSMLRRQMTQKFDETWPQHQCGA